jgi:large subunit ribosomal protein L4
MKFKLYSADGKATSKTVEGSPAVFGIEPNEHVVYLAVKAEQTNLRQGSVKTKNRSEASGGGAKPWKQKGRGTARSGSRRSPIWVGGGHTFAIDPKQHNMRLPKKVRRLARRSVLSDKASNKAIYVIESFQFDTPKTKQFMQLLEAMELNGKKTLILTADFNENLFLSGRNVKNMAILEAPNASAYDLLDNEVILMDQAAVQALNEQLAN